MTCATWLGAVNSHDEQLLFPLSTSCNDKDASCTSQLLLSRARKVSDNSWVSFATGRDHGKKLNLTCLQRLCKLPTDTTDKYIH